MMWMKKRDGLHPPFACSGHSFLMESEVLGEREQWVRLRGSYDL